jgi:hypothetical protein
MLEALRQNSELQKEVEHEKEIVAKEQQTLGAATAEVKGGESSGKLIMAEESAEGHVAWPALKMYFLAFGGSLLWTTVVMGCIGASTFGTLQPWFLGEWARQYEHRPANEISVS